jgi:hypothetical protein
MKYSKENNNNNNNVYIGGIHNSYYIKGVYVNMKKIFVVIGICIVLAAMPMTTALPLFNLRPINIIQNARPALTNGTFNGEYAMKNESGYIPLGVINGTYESWNWTASFVGTWTAYEGNTSGALQGWVWGHLFYGTYNTTGSQDSEWFIGLYRLNTTTNTFRAGAILFGEDDNFIRYAMGSL